MKLLLMGVLLLPPSTAAAGSDTKLLYEGNLQHQRKLSGLQFHVKTSRSIENDFRGYAAVEPKAITLFGYETPVDFYETLALRYNPADAEHPWRTRWICNYADEQVDPLFKLRAFFVLDDKNLRKFVRPDYRHVGKLSLDNHEDYFKALTAGGAILPKGFARLEHPFFDAPSHVLLMSGKGLSIYQDPSGNVGREVQGWHVTGREEFLGRDAVRLEFESGKPTESGYVIMLTSPDFVVVEMEASERTKKGKKVFRRLSTTKLGSFQGITYPAAGNIMEAVMFSDEGDVWSIDTKFEIRSVEPIPESILKAWVPPFPDGTYVNENDRITHIPFNEEFRNAALRSIAANPQPKKSVLWFAPAFFVVLGVLGFYYWRKNQNAT